MPAAAHASNAEIRRQVHVRDGVGNWAQPPAAPAPEPTPDQPCVHLRAHGVNEQLTVQQVMTNDGQFCGPEWGWLALQEMHAYGHALDTDDETWECIDPDALYAQALAYYDEHLAGVEDPTDPFGDSPATRVPREWESAGAA